MAERIRERVANVVLFELQDPRITFPTVTRVRLAKDRSTCKVFFSVLGSEADRTKTTRALEDARGFIQREVAKVLHIRTVPILSFHYDESVEGGLRMEGLLKNLKNERDEAEIMKEGDLAPDDPVPDGD
ncbi:MAG: 30S ribosome-binding factor RbfA [Planctomycetota bacterium]